MAKILIKIVLVFATILMVIIGFFIGVWITGRDSRSYQVYSPDTKISGFTVGELAERFKPILYQSNNITPEPEFMYYEATDYNNSLVIIYRVVWKDEYHPNPFIHSLYSMYRYFYYGSVKDIEFIEYIIDYTTLYVKEVHFETLKEGSSLQFPKHEFVKIKNSSGLYQMIKENQEYNLTYNPFMGKHIILQVITWNHLLSVTDNPSGNMYNLTLKFLTNGDFIKYKMGRRSAGYVKQHENKAITYVVTIGTIITFALIPNAIYVKRKK